MTSFAESHSRVRVLSPRYVQFLLAMSLLVGVTSCRSYDPAAESAGIIDGNVDGSVTSPLGPTSGEPNDTFAEAIVAVFDTEGLARLHGSIGAADDVDVYLLGVLARGQQVIIDTETIDSDLDVTVGVFNADERLVAYNDDRGGTDERFLDAYLSWVTRRSSDRYYLVVAKSGLAASGRTNGTYGIDISTGSGTAVPEPRGQALLLDFNGGTLDLPVFGEITVDTFTGEAIDLAYAGKTEELKQVISETVKQNFSEFNVCVWSTDEGEAPNVSAFSTVLFGGSQLDYLGQAEAVDPYNSNPSDRSVVYTESFTPDRFTVVPSAAELGVAIGNVASHEIGALLGLRQVTDDGALMSVAESPDGLLANQRFTVASLAPEVLRIGRQDAVLLLEDTVGLAQDDGCSAHQPMENP